MSIHNIYYKFCTKGHTNGNVDMPVTDKFCRICGSALYTHCTKCGTELNSVFQSPLFFTTGKPVNAPHQPGACSQCGNRFPWTSWWRRKTRRSQGGQGIGIVGATIIAAIIVGVATIIVGFATFLAPVSPKILDRMSALFTLHNTQLGPASIPAIANNEKKAPSVEPQAVLATTTSLDKILTFETDPHFTEVQRRTVETELDGKQVTLTGYVLKADFMSPPSLIGTTPLIVEVTENPNQRAGLELYVENEQIPLWQKLSVGEQVTFTTILSNTAIMSKKDRTPFVGHKSVFVRLVPSTEPKQKIKS